MRSNRQRTLKIKDVPIVPCNLSLLQQAADSIIRKHGECSFRCEILRDIELAERFKLGCSTIRRMEHDGELMRFKMEERVLRFCHEFNFLYLGQLRCLEAELSLRIRLYDERLLFLEFKPGTPPSQLFREAFHILEYWFNCNDASRVLIQSWIYGQFKQSHHQNGYLKLAKKGLIGESNGSAISRNKTNGNQHERN